MRVAALAFGVLAGLVASLILALGGLDVGADTATPDRQAQAIRFGLLVIGNLGIFGAALVLASPLAGGIILVVGALAWVGAALLTHHTTDLVLITPPALLLVSAILAGVAHFRRPRPEGDDEPEIEIIAPERAQQRPSDLMGGSEEEMGIPAFAAEAQPPPSRGYDDDRLAPRDDDWNPRRRPPPPPRTKPAFRPIEEEYDDEPTGFSRFALGLSSVLSFGLYAALAGAAVLVMWNLRDSGTQPPAAVVAEAPVLSADSSSEARLSSRPTSSEEPSSAAPALGPALTASTEPSRQVSLPPLSQPSSEPPAVSVASDSFGDVTMTPDGIPALSDSFESDTTPTASLEPSTASSLEPTPEPSIAPSSESAPAVADPAAAAPEPTQVASVPAAGQPFPRLTSAQLASLRQTESPGVTTVATPAPRTNTTGL